MKQLYPHLSDDELKKMYDYIIYIYVIYNSEYFIDLFKSNDIFMRRIRSEMYDRYRETDKNRFLCEKEYNTIFPLLPSNYMDEKLNDRRVYLITQYFVSNNSERQKEIDFCLQYNLNNNKMYKILLINEREYDFKSFHNSQKIVQVYILLLLKIRLFKMKDLVSIQHLNLQRNTFQIIP